MPRDRRFKVEITEHWIEDEPRKEWKQLREPETSARLEQDGDYGYVTEVLPTAHSRTVLEAEVESLEIERVVAAVYALSLASKQLPEARRAPQ